MVAKCAIGVMRAIVVTVAPCANVAMRAIVVIVVMVATCAIAATVPTVHRPRCVSPSGGVGIGTEAESVTEGGLLRNGAAVAAAGAGAGAIG